MLKNAYLLAKIGADTAENERNFAKNAKNLATTLPLRPEEDPVSTTGEKATETGRTATFSCQCRLGCSAKLEKRAFVFCNLFLKIDNTKFEEIAILQILQIFGGLVLGCIKTKICKKICV